MGGQMTGAPESIKPRRADFGGRGAAEVAAGLRHLPGLVFFDSAGNLPAESGQPISVIAARPERVITGQLPEVGELRRALGARTGADRGFPLGGLCGAIDYDGSFTFGVYPEMLVQDVQTGDWWEVGELSRAWRDPRGEAAVDVGPFQQEMSRAEFIAAVERAQEYIAAGDIYQVNLSQRFSAAVSGGSLFGLYEVLRDASPAPLAAWLALGGREVLCSSPETFLRLSGRGIETRPVKGTRPRFADPEADSRSAYELVTSEKEIAELVMITDLERNDLGQVCEFGSVRVTDLLRVERLAQVYHLVSTVSGTLREGFDHLDALAACFPGGSITGAPKKRAMEIIAELEPVPRGLYTGAVGYLGYNGESQLNIVIRSLVREAGHLHYHVGAGIVADSSAALEYEETLHKAAGIRAAIGKFTGAHPD
jgi:para-aminobenzoate synthetase component 1